MAYETLRTGSRSEEVKKLQQALQSKGYDLGSAGVDGIYGEKTAAAVRKYQSDNALQIDGIAGNETQSHLYGIGQNIQPSTPQNNTYQQLQTQVQQFQSQKPQYTDAYAQKLEQLYQQVVDRPDFRYNVNEDALLRQYQDHYTGAGRLAMEDTLGKAATLTGGYGSAYGQSAAQQAYGNYMQQLTGKIPELEQRAYERYQQENDALLDQYSMTLDQAQQEYSRYQDALDRYWQELNYRQSQADQAYEREQTAQALQYEKQRDAYDRLQTLISATGYAPTAAELEAAGMTAGQAQQLKRAYTVKNTAKTSGTGSAKPTAEQPEELRNIDFKSLHFDSYLQMQTYLKNLWSTKGKTETNRQLDHWVQQGYLDAASAENLKQWLQQQDKPSSAEQAATTIQGIWDTLKKMFS